MIGHRTSFAGVGFDDSQNEVICSEEDPPGLYGTNASEDEGLSANVQHIACQLDSLLEGQARIEEALLQLQAQKFAVHTPVSTTGVSKIVPEKASIRASTRVRTRGLDTAQSSLIFAPAKMVGWALPAGWPQSLERHRYKAQGAHPPSPEMVLIRFERRREEDNGMLSSCSVIHATKFRETVLENRVPQWLRDSALHPYGKSRIVWDQASCLVLAYELTLLPLVLVWNVRATGLQLYIAYVLFAFWIADLLLNFVTGVCRDGRVNLSLRRAAASYIRGWFVLDFAILVANGVSLLLSSSDGESDNSDSVMLLRFAKGARILRIISVMRVMRIKDKIKRIVDRYAAGEILSLAEVPGLMLVLMFISHWVACGWFAISVYSDTDTGRSWTTSALPGTEVHYNEIGIGHQYATAYHWALSQMTSGAMGLQAESTSERTFNIVVLIVGVVISSTIVSRLTARLAEYSALKSMQSQALKALTNYLRRVGITHTLVITASLQAKDKMMSLEESSFNPMSALDILPANTQASLYHELCRTNLVLPLFRVWEIIDGDKVASLACKQFISFCIVCKGDETFRAASEAQSAYVVVQGLLRYTQMPENSLVEGKMSKEVASFMFLAEAALYCKWMHVGTAEALRNSDVMMVNPDSFRQEIQKSAVMSWVCNAFSKAFHATITAPEGFGSMSEAPSYPSDLEVPHVSELVQAMPKPIMDIVGLSAIEALRIRHRSAAASKTSFTVSRKGFLNYCQELEEEVLDGKCSMTLLADGSVERVATVVTVKLCRGDGSFLVHLASVKADGTCKAKVELPGSKQIAGEKTQKVLARIMEGWLRPFANLVKLGDFREDSTDKVQKVSEYSVRLTYTRKCMKATARDTCDAAAQVCCMGSYCCALNISNALLLARPTSRQLEEVEYSLWAWLSDDEFKQLRADDGTSKLSRALEEYLFLESNFTTANLFSESVAASTADDELIDKAFSVTLM